MKVNLAHFNPVMHIVSSVEGKLAADRTNYDLMRATFPAGTVSGAPKSLAMQISSELAPSGNSPPGFQFPPRKSIPRGEKA